MIPASDWIAVGGARRTATALALIFPLVELLFRVSSECVRGRDPVSGERERPIRVTLITAALGTQLEGVNLRYRRRMWARMKHSRTSERGE